MTTVFNPRDHLMQIKNRNGSSDYLPVQFRLVWFREQCPEGTITTEIVHLDLDKETEEEAYVWNNDKRRSEKVIKTGRGIAIVRATITDGKGGVATGTKMEKAASFPDWLEKAETGSIGRALAALGYGTQFAPELDEAHRIVDSPVEHASQPQQSPPSAESVDASITEQQLASIRKLCEHLGKPEPEMLNALGYANAKALIQRLTAEYKESRQNDHRTAQPSGAVNTPTTSQKTASGNSGAIETPRERANALLDRAIALGEIDGSLSKQERGSAFFKLAGEVCHATISHIDHLVKSRLDAVEAYLDGKEQQ